MERFVGARYVIDTFGRSPSALARRALQACEGAPVDIERGAVVKLAEALEMFLTHTSCEPTGNLKGMRDLTRRVEWYEGLDVVREEARKALRAYYGGTEHGD